MGIITARRRGLRVNAEAWRVRNGVTAAWRIREVDWPAEPVASARTYAAGGELAWLDSAVSEDLETPAARYSLLCVEPLARIEQFDGCPAVFSAGERVIDRDASGWRLWRRAARKLPTWPQTAWRLSPGWVGYLGFETAGQLERLPRSHREDLGLPVLRLTLFERAIVLDHQERRAFAVAAVGLREALGLPAGDSADGATWVDRWQHAATAEPQPLAQPRPRLRYEIRQADYERMVTRALGYIAAGDIYQVNIAQRLRLEGIGDPLTAYAALRRTNPAPYAGLLSWPGGAVASVSPELFLRARGDEVVTRPIKGTRPRTRDPVLDDAYRRQLLASEKDAAELAMIVDLHRNDLGRVCAYKSVRVAHARRIETHPTVFHTVADIVGRLAPGRDALDLLAACFPAGSISGVPKIRALQIIDELEPVARGVYTGAIGVLGVDGQMSFNVAIRTVQINRTTATLYVGGGIVADSDPIDEYEETLAKARGIVDALRAPSDESRVGSATLDMANGDHLA
jgi:para-aminobenzoate synthetase component 1